MLDELVACPKEIIDPPKREMVSHLGSLRNDMRVACDRGRQFRVFMRINEAFAEDFSIGIKFEPIGDGGLILLRCNGPHGEFVNSLTDPLPPHYSYHIHRASKANLDKGRKPEAGAEFTDLYASYEQALKVFLKLANIQWTETHFPGLEQKRLFNE